MNTQDTNSHYTTKELRQFAFVMAGMILFLFALFFPWLYGMGFSYIPYIISALFISAAVIIPKILTPVYRLWMKFAHVIGLVNSKIILFIIFYLIIAPMGLAAKIFGYDPMKKKNTSASYYILRKEDKNNMENPF